MIVLFDLFIISIPNRRRKEQNEYHHFRLWFVYKCSDGGICHPRSVFGECECGGNETGHGGLRMHKNTFRPWSCSETVNKTEGMSLWDGFQKPCPRHNKTCPHLSIYTVSDPYLLIYGLISMVWTVAIDFNSVPFSLDRKTVRSIVSIRV